MLAVAVEVGAAAVMENVAAGRRTQDCLASEGTEVDDLVVDENRRHTVMEFLPFSRWQDCVTIPSELLFDSSQPQIFQQYRAISAERRELILICNLYNN